ncbi:MAG TPA: monovalent cation/H(+) antiporter subunit G [Methanosarcinales archaeon]|nr:monovalent cation/H(+) antiporter subunit G [Methanosarcinales archaeon]
MIDIMIYSIIILLLLTGTFFLVVGTIGLLRFPDFYTRMHATGKCDTLGQGLVLIGLTIFAFYSRYLLNNNSYFFVGIKILFIITFIFIANPTATHAIARAAYNSGVKLWKVREAEE